MGTLDRSYASPAEASAAFEKNYLLKGYDISTYRT